MLILVSVILATKGSTKKRGKNGQVKTVVDGYRSSEALSSRTAVSKAGPSSVRARQAILVVLPVPGGP